MPSDASASSASKASLSAWARVAMASVAVGLASLIEFYAGATGDFGVPVLAWTVVGLYFAGALAVAMLARKFAGLSQDELRMLGLILDSAASSAAVVGSGELWLLLFALYPVMTVTYGVRRGPAWAALCASTCGGGFVMATFLAGWWLWQAQMLVGALAVLMATAASVALVSPRRSRFSPDTPTVEAVQDAESLSRPELRALERALRPTVERVHQAARETLQARGYGTERLSPALADLNQTLDSIALLADTDFQDSPPPLQDFDLNRLIDELKNFGKQLARTKGLQFDTQMRQPVYGSLHGSALGVRQVMQNLIKDALRHTYRGAVQLDVSVLDRSEGGYRLQFVLRRSDRSPYPSMRDPVVAAGARIGEQGPLVNLGLELAAAHCRVEQMNGRLWLGESSAAGVVSGCELAFQRGSTALLSPQQADSTVLMLVHDDVRARSWSEMIATWSDPPARVANADAALALLEQAGETGARWRWLIVDEQGLDRDPESFAAGVRSVSGDDALALMLIARDPRSEPGQCPLGFDACLSAPVDKRLLFNSLHDRRDMARDPRVIALADRFAQTDAGVAPLRILVAEDNRTNQLVLRHILERGGHRVTVVDNGELAFDRLEAQAFDLAIVDMQMPIMGGLDVVKLYRFTAPRSLMPFIILTANTSEAALAECRDAGVDEFLIKPVEPDRLLQVVATHGARARAAQAAPASAPPVSGETVVFDQEKLNQLAQAIGNQEQLEHLLKSFLTDVDRLSHEMRDAARHGNQSAYRMSLQTLQSMAAEVGAMSIHHLHGLPENLPVQDFRRFAQQQFDRLHTDVPHLRRQIERYLAEQRGAR